MADFRLLLERILTDCLGTSTLVEDFQWQMGGDINRAASVRSGQQYYFIKWNEAQFETMFEAEAQGLELLAKACPLKVPEVIGYGAIGENAYLVLEHLRKGFQNAAYWQKLGEGLACLHMQKQDGFGLGHDNYIGRLPQVNSPEDSWIDFFIKHRLGAQLRLAQQNDYVTNSFVGQFEEFLKKLPEILPEAIPALLHGDLWNGNAMAVTGKQASIYDPAVYKGAREMDLAMTRLFGGFDERFYEAYHTVYPIPNHFEELLDVYNLYPLMVHVNLFGSGAGYSRSVAQIISRYI